MLRAWQLSVLGLLLIVNLTATFARPVTSGFSSASLQYCLDRLIRDPKGTVAHQLRKWEAPAYDFIARWIQDNDLKCDVAVVTEAGRVPYGSPDCRFIDLPGLTDPFIAGHIRTDARAVTEYLLSQSPDFFLLQQNLGLLNTLYPSVFLDARFAAEYAASHVFVYEYKIFGSDAATEFERQILFTRREGPQAAFRFATIEEQVETLLADPTKVTVHSEQM